MIESVELVSTTTASRVGEALDGVGVKPKYGVSSHPAFVRANKQHVMVVH